MLLYKNKEYELKVSRGRIQDDVAWMFLDALDEVESTMSPEKLEENIDSYQHDDYDNRILFVLYHDLEPVGLLACYRAGDTATEEHWYVKPQHRKFANIKAMRKFFGIWQKGIGAKEILYNKVGGDRWVLKQPR